MFPRPPALDTAAASAAPDALAIPARRIGCLIPSKSHNGVCKDILLVFVRTLENSVEWRCDDLTGRESQ